LTDDDTVYWWIYLGSKTLLTNGGISLLTNGGRALLTDCCSRPLLTDPVVNPCGGLILVEFGCPSTGVCGVGITGVTV
jgi:hypothetical protein